MRRWWMLTVVAVALVTSACSASEITGDTAPQEDQGSTAADIGGPMRRDGTLHLDTADDSFDQTYAKAIAVADRFGAEVVDAVTNQRPNELPTGSLTLSVRDDQYTAVLTAMSELGRVRSQRIDATRRSEPSGSATSQPGRVTEPRTYSRLMVRISEPRGLVNTVRATWGIAREVMLYSLQAVMLLVAFAIPFLIAAALWRLGVWGWRRLMPSAMGRPGPRGGGPGSPEPQPFGA
jgi:hypothetical protein